MSIKSMVQDVCVGTGCWGISMYGEPGINRPKILKLFGELTHNDLMRDGFMLHISRSKTRIRKLFKQLSQNDQLIIQITSPNGKVWSYYD